MFTVMRGGEGVRYVRGDGKVVRGVSHIQGGERG